MAYQHFKIIHFLQYYYNISSWVYSFTYYEISFDCYACVSGRKKQQRVKRLYKIFHYENISPETKIKFVYISSVALPLLFCEEPRTFELIMLDLLSTDDVSIENKFQTKLCLFDKYSTLNTEYNEYIPMICIVHTNKIKIIK